MPQLVSVGTIGSDVKRQTSVYIEFRQGCRRHMYCSLANEAHRRLRKSLRT